MDEDAIRRFFEKISHDPVSGCWLWTAGCCADGYGNFRNGKMVGAHRVSWELHVGPIPDGLCVLHTCDNPPCVNPTHLFLGTHADNIADRDSKGRQAGGERHGCAKLTADDVRRIQTNRDPQRVIADKYGVSPRTISNIQCGRSWKHTGGGGNAPAPGHAMGARNGNSKLTEDGVRAIRVSAATSSVLSSKYDVAPSTINRIRNRKAWGHLS